MGFNKFLIATIVASVVAAAFIITTGIFADKALKAEADKPCTTKECVLAAADLLEAMNATADPCDDFFQFACGGWVRKNPIPDSKSRYTQFDVLRDQLTATMKTILTAVSSTDDVQPVKQARELYQACMDTETIEGLGLKPLTDLLALFGGWPMTLASWNETSFSWTEATAAARKLYGSSILLRVFTYLDSMNTNTSAIYIDQSSLSLPRSVLVAVDDANNAALVAAYRNYAENVALAITQSLGQDVPLDAIQADVNATLAFEVQLAQITKPQEDRRNNTRLYNPLKVSEVQGWTDSAVLGQINWKDYLASIYGEDITDDERVIVVETEYLKQLVTLLDATPLRTVANYVHWRLVNSLAADTTQQMIDYQFEFSSVQLGTSQPAARWLTCTNKVNNLMGYAVSSEYVKNYFSDAAKQELELMIEQLKTSFKSLVDDAPWMDEVTKVVAREKADYMRQLVAYPDWVKNASAVTAYYNGLSSAAGAHFQNVQNANAFLVSKEDKDLRQTTDRTKWTTFPTVVNAFFEPERNSITFPAGILQIPFYGNGRLTAMNFGAIGMVIGHEITHGFDDQGRQSDKFGNTADWWSQETITNYLARAQCFIDQYSAEEPLPNVHLNGINTQGENIADNGGLREAFRAYVNYEAENGVEPRLPGLDQFTARQIFFLAYANVWCGGETDQSLQNTIATDPHSPNYYRVNVPLSNSDDFAREFSCPAGSKMNPANKCVLW